MSEHHEELAVASAPEPVAASLPADPVVEVEKDVTVTLMGKDWVVKPLVPRQLRVVVPAVMRWFAIKGDAARMNEKNFDDLMQVIHVAAIQPNDKTITLNQLFDMPLKMYEIAEAVQIISKMSGVFREVKPGESSTGQAATA